MGKRPHCGTGFNSEHNLDKCGFIAKGAEWKVDKWMENY